MKKHFIAALIGVLTLAVTAPAFAAANVGGSMDFKYSYDVMNNVLDPDTDTSWGLNLSGKVSDDVSYKVGFGANPIARADQPLNLNEASIQAQNTPIGTLKLGAFDMTFGEGNELNWAGPMNIQISNTIAGLNVAAGAQFSDALVPDAVGASLNVKPIESLEATVGVIADSADWQPEIGYSATFTGIDHLTVGVKGNLASKNTVASAEYEILPGIKASAMYGLNVANDDLGIVEANRMEAGLNAALANGLRAGASYAVAERGDGQHQIISANAGYDFSMAKGFTVSLDGGYTLDNGTPSSSVGLSTGVTF